MANIPEGIQLTPFDPEFARDPYSVYKRLREAAPVHWDGTSYTISGYAEVEALLKDPRLSVEPGKLGLRRDPRADNTVTRRAPDMMNLDAPEHTRLRKLVNRAFTPSSVKAFRAKIEAIAKQLTASLPTEFDAVERLAKPLPTIAIAEYIGIDPSRHVEFKQWTETLLMQGYPLPSPGQWDAIVGADTAMRDCISQSISERRQALADDLVSRLIESEATTDEVIDMCCLLVGAGNFTTTDLISNALLRFTEDDRSRIGDFVDDTLRLDTPALSLRRWTLEDIEIGDKVLKKGRPVLLLLAAANHDSHGGPHLSFGRGIHHCLGAALARAEAEVALECMPPFEVTSFKHRKSLMFRGCTKLQVRLT